MIFEEKFIVTPIETIIEEAVCAFSVLGNGIETYPVSEYMFQSLFLKMTGAQEQKLRCICWFVSTYDYSFRYEYLKSYKDLGEFSTYKNKNEVYTMLNGFIGEHNQKNLIIDKDVKTEMIRESAKNIARLFDSSQMKEWNLRQYRDFKSRITSVTTDELALPNKLLTRGLKEQYDNLNYNRNKYAHNTISYQQNIPSLKSLVKEGDKRNYYDWFFLLILLDKVFRNRFEVVKTIVKQAE